MMPDDVFWRPYDLDKKQVYRVVKGSSGDSRRRCCFCASFVTLGNDSWCEKDERRTEFNSTCDGFRCKYSWYGQ